MNEETINQIAVREESYISIPACDGTKCIPIMCKVTEYSDGRTVYTPLSDAK